MGRWPVATVLVLVCALTAPAMATAADDPPDATALAAAAEGSQTITVTPNGDLVDGETVAVTGSDWASGEHVELRQCVASTRPGFFDCDDSRARSVVAGLDGTFEDTVAVKVTMRTGEIARLDCRVSRCVLVAFRVEGDVEDVAQAALSFRGGLTDESSPAPPVAVEPRFTG